MQSKSELLFLLAGPHAEGQEENIREDCYHCYDDYYYPEKQRTSTGKGARSRTDYGVKHAHDLNAGSISEQGLMIDWCTNYIYPMCD